MHYHTKHIIKAKNEAEALLKATENAESLVGENMFFDWYADNGGRWDDCWKAISLDTEEGLISVKDTWHDQLQDYEYAFEKVKDFFDKGMTLENLLEDSNLVRHYMLKLGEYEGLYMYDTNGDAIRSKGDFDCAVTKDKTLNTYVVAIDMHG